MLMAMMDPINAPRPAKRPPTSRSPCALFVAEADGELVGSDTTAPYEVSLDTTTLTDGTHRLFVEAFDNEGNSGTDTSRALVKQARPGTRRYTGPPPDDVDYGGDAGFLVVDPGAGPVTVMVPLRRSRLELNTTHEYVLRVGGSQSIRALSYRILRGTQPAILLGFDRRQLISAIAAGISSGDVQLRSGIEVELFVDGAPMGVSPLCSGPGDEGGM